MLRNTRHGNELAVPATNALQRSIVWVRRYYKWLGARSCWVLDAVGYCMLLCSAAKRPGSLT